MIYIFAAAVFGLCLALWWRTPAHDRLARLFFRLGMIGAVLVALLAYLLFHVILPPPGQG